jgi:uncharacterized protein (TIGR04255 family)
MGEARGHWQKFLEILGPVVIGRLAVRYINAIEVPIGADFDEYLTAGPRIPQPLPQLYTSFVQRVTVPFDEVNGYAIITQALELPGDKGPVTVMDIDVACNCSIGGAASESWERLSKLRDIKNRIFFASVTPKALEAYK